MAYLFLSFVNKQLEPQYDQLAYKLEDSINFRTFIESCFPSTMEIEYYFSLPVIERAEEKYNKGERSMKNVVLIPQKTDCAYSLPSNLCIAAKGKISIVHDKYFRFDVEFIDLIDIKCCPSDDLAVTVKGQAVLAFNCAYFGKGSDYDKVSFTDTCLNSNVVKALQETKPVPNPEKARSIINEWESYIRFREYMLNADCDAKYTVESEVFEAYYVEKREYNRHQEWEACTVVSDNGGAYLSENKSEAVGEPMLKLTIKGQERNVNIEKRFRRFAKNLLKLTTSGANEKDKGFSFSGDESLVNVKTSDVKPDYSSIDKEIDKEIETAKNEIKGKHDKAAKAEMELKKAEKQKEFAREYIEESDAQLPNDVDEDKDPKIRKINDKEKNDKMSKELDRLYELAKKHHQEEEEKEIEEKVAELEEERKRRHNDLDERETKSEVELYFKFDNEVTDAKKIAKEVEGKTILQKDPRLEKTKLNRQENALERIKTGDLKNPMMGTFLFSPELLPAVENINTTDNVEWVNQSLNDSQKKAVAMALNASGIFLLQGPPGTGKTTVIGELTAQYVKRGMKVLIASETNKAIDGAFDEIEKLNVPHARLLRLMSSTQNNKQREKKWSMEKLTENFYNSILDNLTRRTEGYKHFEESRDRFDQTMLDLRGKLDVINRLKEETDRQIKEQKQLEARKSEQEKSIQNLKQTEKEISETIDDLQSAQNRIHNLF